MATATRQGTMQKIDGKNVRVIAPKAPKKKA